jgi:peroxiredoxin-like protein
MSTTHYYDVAVIWQHDRKGVMSSTVLNDALDVATPPEFAKGMAGIWSPEHLLVAAVNSCMMTTFLAIADNSQLEFVSFASDAVGKLEVVEGKYMISEVRLSPKVTLAVGTDSDKALKLLAKAEANCLITNSIKARIDFHPRVEVLTTV